MMIETKKIENGREDVCVDRKCAEATQLPLDKKELARICRKVDRRVLPLLAVLFLLCFLDRSNIGNAKVLNSDTDDDLMHELGMSESQYRIAMIVFIVGYSVFETPSNMMMNVLNPPLWMGILAIVFGSMCAGIGGAKNISTLMALRFFLGVAEAGVLPGILFYFSFWYGPRARALRISVIICAIALSGAFGGLIAYGVSYMNGAKGLSAWRWLFIIEGTPCIVLGTALIVLLPSYPEKAQWLTPQEKELLLSSLGDNVSKGHDKLNWDHAKATLKEFRLWIHYLAYCCNGITISSLSLFAPSIVNGIGYEGVEAQLFVIPPYACAFFATILSSYLSDRYQNRGLVIAASCVIGLITFLIQACVPTPSLHLRYAMLVISTCSSFALIPILGAWVSDNVHTTTASALVNGLIITFTGPGQIIGVWIYKDEQAPRYQLGHGVNAGALALCGTLSFGLWWFYSRKNTGLPSGARKWVA